MSFGRRCAGVQSIGMASCLMSVFWSLFEVLPRRGNERDINDLPAMCDVAVFVQLAVDGVEDGFLGIRLDQLLFEGSLHGAVRNLAAMA